MSNTNLSTVLSGTGPVNFLGCSVISFSSQLGWGLDSSTFNVELVEDCENGDRFWGRDQELIGTARYFDLTGYGGNFFFGGIVTGWTENKSSSGQTFSVQMQDTKQLLSGVTVVLDSYSWAPITYYNFYNVYAKYESSVLLGNCSAFGTAKSDQRGMNYQNILKALLVTAQQDQGDSYQRPYCYSPTAGVASQNAVFQIDLGLLYDLNTDTFTATRPDHIPLGPYYYKLAGSITILDLINNICELTGRNVYTDLYYDINNNTNVIRVRCVHLVDSFAGNYETLINQFDGVATNISYGKEFNNPKTRSMVFGENVSYLSQATDFVPFFGVYERPVNILGTIVPARYPIAPIQNISGKWLSPDGTVSDQCGFWFYMDMQKLNVSLYTPLKDADGNVVDGAWISEKDLQTALASETLWKTRTTAAILGTNGKALDPEIAPIGSLNYYLGTTHPELLHLMRDVLTSLVNTYQNRQVLPISDFAMNTLGGGEKAHENQKLVADLKCIYNFINDLASTYYGKKYVFKLNEQICANWADPDSQNGEIKYSSYPTNEGGWVDYGYGVLGMVDPYLSVFRADDGRVQCFALWNNQGYNGPFNTIQASISTPQYSGILDISELNGEDYVSDGTNIWIKGSVEETVYFVTDVRTQGLVPAGVIEFPSPAFLRPQSSLDLANQAQQALTALAILYRASSPQDASKFDRITRISISEHGTGYSVNDTFVFEGGDGNASGVITAVDENGSIRGVSIINGGTSYTPNSQGYTITFNGTGNGATGVGYAQSIGYDKFCGLPTPGSVAESIGKPDNIGFPDLNHKGTIKVAIRPNAAAIPMKSNTVVYGPFFSNNFATNFGGVNVEQDRDLAPWKFGSTTLMLAAGNAKAQTAFANGETPLVISENGNVSVPGLPMYSLGGQILVNGVATGPLVNNINVSFGSQGISTSYDFKTFSRKFGNLTAIQTEQIKLVSQNREKQLKYMRDNIIGINNIYRKALRKAGGNKIEQQHNRAANAQNTTNRILAAEMYDWAELPSGSGQRTVVALEGLDKLPVEVARNYSKKSIMSLDGLFSPISMSGDGNLPRYALFDVIENSSKSSSINPNPPVSGRNFEINRNHLNPLSNPSTTGLHHSGPACGHSIDILARGTGVPESGVMSSMYTHDQANKYSNDYRFLGLKGPLVLHSWGYDLEGKPVPNLTDNESATKSGVFKSSDSFSAGETGLQDYFLDNWLQKPATWPVAPIDLRYDRNRGVWVSPPEHKIVVVQANDSISAYNKGSGNIVNKKDSTSYGSPIYDSSGNLVPSEDANIIIEDRIGNAISSGTKSYAYFDSYTSTYLLIGGGDSSAQIMTARATSSFNPNSKTVSCSLITNATLSGEEIGVGYSPNCDETVEVITAYNPKKCGALGGDLVTLQKVGVCSATGVLFENQRYSYIVIDTGDNGEV